MVQVTVSWGSQFQRAETNIVQSFVVQQEGLIGVLHQPGGSSTLPSSRCSGDLTMTYDIESS